MYILPGKRFITTSISLVYFLYITEHTLIHPNRAIFQAYKIPIRFRKIKVRFNDSDKKRFRFLMYGCAMKERRTHRKPIIHFYTDKKKDGRWFCSFFFVSLPHKTSIALSLPRYGFDVHIIQPVKFFPTMQICEKVVRNHIGYMISVHEHQHKCGKNDIVGNQCNRWTISNRTNFQLVY